MPDDDDLSKKKKTAILAILQHADADFNRAMDAIVSIATAAKRKTSVGIIGTQAIMNEKEPVPDPVPDPVPEPGPEPEPELWPEKYLKKKKEDGPPSHQNRRKTIE